MAIDIGAAAIDRESYLTTGRTRVALDNPANATGTIDTVAVWCYITTLTGFIAGAFYLVAGTDYKCRDSEFIGNVTADSKQTFSGLSIDAVTGDNIGHYYSGGLGIDLTLSGYAGSYSVVGEYIDPNDQATYTLFAGQAWSVYGTGTEAGGGWVNIAKVNGVASAAIAKMNGVAVAAIAKVNGVAV